MTSPDFATGEAGGVQLPALHTLAGLGWRYVPRGEADGMRAQRLGETLLMSVLTDALHRLNAGVTDGAVADAAQRLVAATRDTSRGAQGANEEATNLLRLGTSIDVIVNGVRRGRQLRFVDWADPAANAFHMTAEYSVECEGGRGQRRPDIVMFVNGVPVVVIEVKASREDAAQGVTQQIRNQGAGEIPRLFATAQVLIAANSHAPLYATAGTPRQFWHNWREADFGPETVARAVNTELDAANADAIFADFAPHRRRHDRLMEGGSRFATPLDEMLVALCTPARLLELIRGFVLVDDGIKKIARHQQFFGVRAALRRLRERDEEGRRRGGVIWHTQGSGKSLTMVMLADAIMREIPGARMILVTDRVDLDDQIRANFVSAGKTVEQARSGRHLLELVRARTDIVTTIIDKFDSALNADPRFRDEDGDVFLLVDESHRSQNVTSDDSMHARMRRVFPRGCYLGFTGTPLLKAERSTFARFGSLIHSYRIDEAVRDKAVVPLLYEGRHVDLTADEGALDRWFDRAVKGLTPEQAIDLKRRMARAREVRGAEPWLREVAADVSEDFVRNWQGSPYKAQLVAPSKRAAVLLHRMLEELGQVTSEVVISGEDDRDGADAVNAEDDDIVRAHLRAVTSNHGALKTYEKGVIRRFKGGGHPEIIIVVDKLLTGFDAPRNRVLYLARPLQEHGLLQAIARVNRLFETEDEAKENGRIIDYAGILGQLGEALTSYSAFAEYDEGDVTGALLNLRAAADDLPDRHAALLDLFKDIANPTDHEAYARRLADDAVRGDFYVRLQAYAKALALAFASETFVRDTSEKQLGVYKADLKRFENLRRAVAHRYADALGDKEMRAYEAQIRKLLDRHIDADGVQPIVPPVDIFDDRAFTATVEAAGENKASVADAIASATAKTITERMDEDPVLYRRFAALIAQVIEDFRAERLAEADYLQRVREVRDEVVRPRQGQDVPVEVAADELAVALWRTAAEALAPLGDTGGAAALIGTAFAAIGRQLARVGWVHNRDVCGAMQTAMEDFLHDEVRDGMGLSALDWPVIDALVERALDILRRRLAQ